jgi:hypothetical protein
MHPVEMLKHIFGQVLGDLPVLAALAAVQMGIGPVYRILSNYAPSGLEMPLNAVFNAAVLLLNLVIWKEIGV